MHEDPSIVHRKHWEYAYIVQALYERDMLRSGRSGLGFAVGKEPLTALFASMGCRIQATDLDTPQAIECGWVGSSQHAGSIDALNDRGICDAEQFRQRVSFRFADMRELPDDLGKYDFLWSSCALEHLGTMELGEKFVVESLKYLRPGGVAVHTTELNLSPDHSTLFEGPTVLFRRSDIERIGMDLRRRGHEIDVDLSEGDLPYDRIVDEPPYDSGIHLRLHAYGHIVTSFGLIICRGEG